MYLNELSHAQAESLALEWVSTSPDQGDWLQSKFPTTVLDYSDSSLRSLLCAAVAEFAFEAPSTEATDLPLWLEDSHYSGYRQLSADSLWLVDALALYLGDLLIARDPRGLRWGVYCCDRPDHPWHHHPAVIGYRWPYSTFEDMAIFATKAARNEPEDPQHVVAAINFYLSVFRSPARAS